MTRTLRSILLSKTAAKRADPTGFTPEWEPEAGWWHPEENPTGWRRPAKPGQRKELFLWDKWKRNGEAPEDIDPLLHSLRPLVYRYGVQQYAGRVPIHNNVLESEARRLAIGGLRAYDPSKAQINTFLRHRLQSTHRFVKKRQNLSRITEGRIPLIGEIQRGKARLADRLGREPSLLELADETKIPVNLLEKALAELRPDLLASGAMENPFLEETPQSRRVLKMIRYELTPKEELVFDYLMGEGGKPVTTSTNVIAKKLGWSPSKVSQTKKSISKKLAQYL